MDNLTIGIVAAFVVMLVLYLMRRRTRTGKED